MDGALEHFKKALAFPPKADAKASAFFVARAAAHVARVLYANEDYAGAESYLWRAVGGSVVLLLFLGVEEGCFSLWLCHAAILGLVFALVPGFANCQLPIANC